MDVRSITEDELEPFYATFMRTMNFGPPQESYIEREKKSFVYDRSIAAFDAGSVVGTAYSHAFELTLPGGAQVPAAGVTAIATASTHRRQGIVTKLKRRQLEEAAARGEVAAILLASEGRIYGRFGYGAATLVADIDIRTKDALLPAPNSGGRVRIVDGEEADKLFPSIFSESCRARAGSLERPAHFWEGITADRDKRAVEVVYENASGQPRGYVRYTSKADWEAGGQPKHELTIGEFVATDDTASLELWWYLLSLDLIRDISAFSRPIDDPLRWALAEPRALRTRAVRDMYWVRPLDVAKLLGGRTYALDLDVKLEVTDPLLAVGGTFALAGDASGATCEPVSGPADVRLSAADVGAISLGGIPASDLARAGRFEASPAVLARLDAAFLTSPRPWGALHF
jgi:predicted acetyltransferase